MAMWLNNNFVVPVFVDDEMPFGTVTWSRTGDWLTGLIIYYSDATNVHPHWIEQIKSKTPQW